MLKLAPIWQNLPVLFKLEMVGRLDFQSRARLRMCSREEKSLVDSVPPRIDFLCLRLAEPVFGDTQNVEKAVEIRWTDERISGSKRFSKEGSIDAFVSIFRENPRLTLETLEINVAIVQHYSHFFQFFKRLLARLTELDLKLKVSHLKVSTVIRDKNQFVTLIGRFDVARIVSMQFARATACQLDEIARSEQWKRTEHVAFETRHELNWHWISHAKRARIRARQLTERTILALIQKFLREPHGSYFSISTFFPIGCSREPALSRVLRDASLTPSHHQNIDLGRHENDVYGEPLHIQTTLTDGGNLQFVLIFCDSNVSGVVCRRDFLDEDLRLFMTE